jgi:hypothetical protein
MVVVVEATGPDAAQRSITAGMGDSRFVFVGEPWAVEGIDARAQIPEFETADCIGQRLEGSQRAEES